MVTIIALNLDIYKDWWFFNFSLFEIEFEKGKHHVSGELIGLNITRKRICFNLLFIGLIIEKWKPTVIMPYVDLSKIN